MALFDEIYNKNESQSIETKEDRDNDDEKFKKGNKYEYKSKTISEKNKAISVLQAAISYIQDEDIDPENIKISISVGKKYRCKYKGNNVGFL